MYLNIQVKAYEYRKAKTTYNLKWRNRMRRDERKDGW
jgi:hypothetical protein